MEGRKLLTCILVFVLVVSALSFLQIERLWGLFEREGEYQTALGENPGRFAIVTYCSCDLNGCVLYEETNRLKDEYCKLHGCKHLTFSFPPTLPDEGFKDHVTVSTSVAAMWALINATRQVIESGDYDWVFPTGGDQVIWRFDQPPSKLLPESVNGGAQYDVVLVVEDPAMVESGLRAPPIIQNTAGGRDFLRRWYSYASRGNYLVEDQGVMNVELLRKIVEDLSTEEERNDPLVQRYLNTTACPVKIPVATYDYLHQLGLKKYVAELQVFSACIEAGLQRFYGERPYTSQRRGRQSTVLLYPVGIGWEGGMGWNLVERTESTFIRHFSGRTWKTRSLMQRFVQETLSRFPDVNIDTPSREFERCVRPLTTP